jgi:LPS-assembly lipoprotein
MSSLDNLSPDAAGPSPSRGTGRGAARLAMIAFLTLGLAACFQPLYGPSVAGGRVSDQLAAIEVAPVLAAQGQERVTHHLRSELVFDLDGSGQPRPKQYKLTVSVTERIATPIIDAVSGRADSATLIANATYTLATLDGTRVITTGSAMSSASYDRHAQRFASVRAARDAEIRIAKLLSEQIKTRIAAALATSS